MILFSVYLFIYLFIYLLLLFYLLLLLFFFFLLQEKYQPPDFPVELPKFTEKVKFGAEMKAKHFFLDVGLISVM